MEKYADVLREMADLLDKDFDANVPRVAEELLGIVRQWTSEIWQDNSKSITIMSSPK